MGRASNRKKNHQQQPPHDQGRGVPIEHVQECCEQYANTELATGMDCFHVCTVLDLLLTRAAIPHQIMFGAYLPSSQQEAAIENRISHFYNPLHMWLVAWTHEGRAIIDYRARATIGPEGGTPHGVFLPQTYPFMRYRGWKARPMFSEASALHLMDPRQYPRPDTFNQEQRIAMEWPEYRVYSELLRHRTPENTRIANEVRRSEVGDMPTWSPFRHVSPIDGTPL